MRVSAERQSVHNAYLEDDLDALGRGHQEGGGDGREETGKGKLGQVEVAGLTAGDGMDDLLAQVIGPEGDGEDGGDSDEGGRHSAVETTDTVGLERLAKDIEGALVGASGAGLDADLIQHDQGIVRFVLLAMNPQ